MNFEDKDEARQYVWEHLQEVGAARFPFPPTGRIPNFAGAEEAAKRLAEQPLFKAAEVVKINPDSPQRPLREKALHLGKVVVVPTPRLRDGFLLFDPQNIDEKDFRDASMISRWEPYAQKVSLDDFPPIDLIVTGCVAVTKEGKRLGKGHGYSDLEYAILTELGQSQIPVVTTVHDEQVVDNFPVDEHDIHLSLVATPTRLWEADGDDVGESPGIIWELLSDEDLEAMPVLQELRQ